MRPLQQRIAALQSRLQQASGPARTQLLLEVSGLLFQAGDFQAAASGYEQVLQSDPDNAAILNNLSACHLELGAFEEAARLASKAIALAPGFEPAYLNRADSYRQSGRPEDAARDYARALQLNPRNVTVLNKAGAFNHLLKKPEEARRQFELALRLAPQFALARLNLGLLEISCARPDAAREQLRRALDDPSLDQASRTVGEVALAILGEQQRLAPHLREALQQRRPERLTAALRSAPQSLLEPDPASMAANERYVAACRELAGRVAIEPYADAAQHLPFIEACFQARFDGDAESLAQACAAQLQDPSRLPRLSSGRSIAGLLEATRLRSLTPQATALDLQAETWVRYWHAVLLADQPGALPGQFKAAPNSLTAKGIIKPTRPEFVIGTLRHALEELRPGVPAGVPRALFSWIAIIRLHAFNDGNGRLARFLFNWELETQGLGAICVSPALRKEFARHSGIFIREANPEPLYETLLKARAETARCLRAIKWRDDATRRA
jgi:Tfp pilus assembly protein PilF